MKTLAEMTLLEQVEHYAKKTNYTPKTGDVWTATYSESSDEWQVWGYEASGGPFECIGSGKTDTDAMRDAVDTLISIINL